MNVDEALSYIHSVNWRGSKPGLSRTRELLSALGNPQDFLRFVHVAGTNGKGSTARFIAQSLTKSGYRTGLYTSPYIMSFNERMQIDGGNISDDDLARLTETIRPAADAMSDAPTEFEIITALAMLYFWEARCDIVVLEVGLGGELDSTNVIKCPEIALITPLALDHTGVLGSTIEDVARAKAGIIKGGTVVWAANDERADAVIRSRCVQTGAQLYSPDYASLEVIENTLEGQTLNIGSFRGLHISMLGSYQPYNAALALLALQRLRESGWDKITDEAINEGFESARWRGRFELLRREPDFVVDGGHNPHGVTAALESFRLYFPNKNPVVLVGVMADKDVEKMLSLMCTLARRFVCVRPDNPRALDEKELAARLRSLGAEAAACGSVGEGVKKAIDEAGKNGAVLALGSLYMTADIIRTVEETNGGKANGN